MKREIATHAHLEGKLLHHGLLNLPNIPEALLLVLENVTLVAFGRSGLLEVFEGSG